MIDQIKNSLAFRLPKLYRKIVVKRILSSSCKGKEKINVTILLMAGKKHADYLIVTLYSILKFWDKLPRLVISTDGTILADDLRKKIAFWPGEISIISPSETTSYHSKKKRNSIVSYSNKSPFGKKLSFIIQYVEQMPCLWIDCDIIFYKDFLSYLKMPQNVENYFGASEDWIMAYDNFLLKNFYPHLKKLTPISTGIFLGYSKNFYTNYDLENIIASAIPDCMHFTEQTILANLCHKSLGILWNKDLIKNYNSDKQFLKPTNIKDVVCRHYTNNVRHLFWRDAFFKL